MKIYTIHPKNIEQGLPVTITIALGLLLDRFHAAGWMYGVLGTVMGFIWLAAILRLFQTKMVDINSFLKDQHERNQIK